MGEQLGRLIVKNGQTITYDQICNSIHMLDSDIVYIGGSIVEGSICEISKGMGNCYSDIDVFIIREHSKFLESSCVYDDTVRKTFFCNDFSVGLDVEIYDMEYVEDFIIALDTIEISTNGRIGNSFANHLRYGNELSFINTFLARLFNSIPIYKKDDYDKLIKKINFSKFLEIMTAQTIVETDGIIYDVYGNIDSDQIDVALHCARNVMLNVMKIILMRNGCFVDREKWVYLKFYNICVQKKELLPFYDVCLMLFRGNLLDKNQCRKLIDMSINASKREIEKIVLGECAL